MVKSLIIKVVGGLFVLLPLGKGIAWLIGVASDVDFIVSQWDSIYKIAQAPWLLLLALIVGLALIWWSTRTKPKSDKNVLRIPEDEE